MDDGTTVDSRPGDVGILPMWHDTWVIEDEPGIVIDLSANRGVH
jgi:hypothetical protein